MTTSAKKLWKADVSSQILACINFKWEWFLLPDAAGLQNAAGCFPSVVERCVTLTSQHCLSCLQDCSQTALPLKHGGWKSECFCVFFTEYFLWQFCAADQWRCEAAVCFLFSALLSLITCTKSYKTGFRAKEVASLSLSQHQAHCNKHTVMVATDWTTVQCKYWCSINSTGR